MPRASERTHTRTNSEISDSGLVKCEIRVSVLGHLQPLPKYQFHHIVKSAIANHFHRLVIDVVTTSPKRTQSTSLSG